jgi:hypothetical protein
MDFDEFLNDFMNQKEGILDEESANYYIGRIKKNKANIEMVAEKAKNILANYKNKVELWSEKETQKYQNDIDHCLEMLRPYFEAHAKDSTTKLKFPEGSLGFYKTARSVKLDEKIILEEIKTLENIDYASYLELQKYIKQVPQLDKALIKKDAKVDETNVFKVGNVVLTGATVTPEKITFTVR